MNKRLQVAKYIFFDLLSSALAWSIFFYYRKIYVESEKFGKIPEHVITEKFWTGIVIIPLSWLLIYFIIGNYKDIYRKSRLAEFLNTLMSSIIGVIALFFISILDDEVKNYKSYYQLFFTLLGLHFGLTVFFRLILSSITNLLSYLSSF